MNGAIDVMAASAAPAQAPGEPGDAGIIPLAILDGYKVRWNRETVARDLVQNFYDEVSDFRTVEVAVDHAARTVRISGPSTFAYDYLRYIGATTKSDPTLRRAGGFGEGFKVCALILLRDYGVELSAGSGTWEIRPFLRPMGLGRELCYEVRHPPEPFSGSFVMLRGCDRELLKTFTTVKELFRHPENPRLAKPLYTDEAAGVGVYLARDSRRGDLYYRGQHRGYLRFSRGAGLTFSFDERIQGLDADRDRRNFEAAGPIIAAIAQRMPDEALERIIRHLRTYWQGGQGILSILLREAGRRGLTWQFPRRWLARSPHSFELEKHAERVGFHLAHRRFAELGMPSVQARFGSATIPRPPTGLEAARMKVAADLYAELTGRPVKARTIRVLELEPRLSFNDAARFCQVPARALAGSFQEGIAACLSALAIWRGVRSVNDADRLTDLLERLIARVDELEGWAERWEAARGSDERVTTGPVVNDRRAMVMVQVLAPAGFPPAIELIERVERLALELGIDGSAMHVRINEPAAAARQYARGLPSIFVGSQEIEPVRGAGWAFAPRTFSGGGVTPTDDVLRTALIAEARKRRGRLRSRSQRDAKRADEALVRYLERHDPERLRKKRIRDMLGKVRITNDGEPLAPRIEQLAGKLAWNELVASVEGTIGDEALGAAVCDAMGRGVQRSIELFERLGGACPELLEGQGHTTALARILEKVEAECGAGMAIEALWERITDRLEPVRELVRLGRSVPLDESCAQTCVSGALYKLQWGLRRQEGEAALARAKEAFDAAVQHAIERHEQVDAYGDPLSCHRLYEALRELDPELAPPPLPETAIAAAVSEAWEAARSGGCDEIEATRRALEAARQASAAVTPA